MDGGFCEKLALFCLLLICLPYPFTALPLCIDLRAPVTPKKSLEFCPYSGWPVCCDATKDLRLQRRFLAMNISDAACASAVKSILCAACDQFSAELFKGKSESLPVPILCNSTDDGHSSSSKIQAADKSFCSYVWDSCNNVPILDSPFAPSLQNKVGSTQNGTFSKLTDLWQSKPEFCNAFGGSSSESDSICFNGKPTVLDETKPSSLLPPDGMCLEKVANGTYLNMVAHPDGTNRAFFSDQPGKIWLATIPQQDSGDALGLDESSPFVDLSDQIYFGNKYGMMGLAFHPNFAENGRFFASYNCDKEKSSSGCVALGRCACNSQVNCDPSKIVSTDAIQPCQIYSVVAEFTANGTASTPSMAEKADPVEVRRIFSMGLPTPSDHGGQILFNAKDGYMYYMMGDGGGKDDPYNFAQNKKSLLGKIMRLDVDNIPSEEEITNLGLWGNYSVPGDNPYTEDKEMAPEVWATGLRNPWRCSFDAERPSYFLCADIGQDRYEEVDLITKGGNYGWDVYEGPLVYNTQEVTTKQNSFNDSFNPIFPVLGYNHSDVNKKTGSAAINGGYVYRSTTTDPCMYGSYLYGDLYAQNIWAAVESPESSGNFTATGIPFSCATDSPVPCNSVPNSPLPALSYIFSFGQDNQKDVFLLTASGVYRVVRPSRCNYKCSKEIVTAPKVHAPPNNTVTSSSCLCAPLLLLKLFFSFVSLLLFTQLNL